MSILDKLLAGHAAVATFEVSGVKIGLRILTGADYSAANVAALNFLKDHEVELTPGSSDGYQEAHTYELISRMVVDLGTKKPVFESAEQCRDTLSRDQQNAIMARYLDHEREHSPAESNMGDEELTALVAEVKKSGPEAQQHLSALSSAMLRRLITILAGPPPN